jgi:hypothetical protein
MRLTRNQEKFWGKGNYKGEKYIIGSDGVTSKQMCLNKLGKLEDLEEQIGCPLDVVVKALKQDYFYTKSGKHSRLEFGTYGFEWCICYELRTQIRVADYKKTWWLKEDKSE